MIIKSLPSELFSKFEESVCGFSDDSRLIYLMSCESSILEITVYDIMFNKSITLLPDSSVTECFNHTKGFPPKFRETKPDFEIVNSSKLLILFNDYFCELSDDPEDLSSLLILVELDFTRKTFLLLDTRKFSNCYYAALLKDAKNDTCFGLLHSFKVEEMRDNDEFLAYFNLPIKNNNQISQPHKDRIVFDFEYEASRRSYMFYLCDNKLWALHYQKFNGWYDRYAPPQPPLHVFYQLSYFALNETSPKEVTFQREIDIDIGVPQWTAHYLLFHDEKANEYSILNLMNGNWSKLKSNAQLIRYKKHCNDLSIFNTSPRIYGQQRTYQLWVDQNLNVTFINQIKKELQRIPLENPQKLGDMVWTTALNNGMLDNQESQKLPNNLFYSKLF